MDQAFETTNIHTLYIKRYHAKQVAMGLCRSCPRPLAPGSKQLCTIHLEAQRKRSEAKNLAEGAVTLSMRKAVREAAMTVFRQSPKAPLETVSKLVGLKKSTMYQIRADALGQPPAKIVRQKVLGLLRSNADMTFSEIAEETGITEATVFRLAKKFKFPTRVRKPYNLKSAVNV
jgi:predicted DNA-binding transcriptional regulator AlpA